MAEKHGSENNTLAAVLTHCILVDSPTNTDKCSTSPFVILEGGGSAVSLYFYFLFKSPVSKHCRL